MLRVGFVHVKTLAVRNNPISKLYQLFRTRGRPYGLQDSLSTLRLSRSPSGSSTDARLDTGGWLTLTRRGLSPRKIRRAFPGAITNMAEWIEVPAHRIYVISARELRDDFDYIGENGRPATRGEIPYRFVRKKDGKVFKWARFAPQCSGVHDYTALEEI